eukprot:283042-Amphidinium_carterae.1
MHLECGKECNVAFVGHFSKYCGSQSETPHLRGTCGEGTSDWMFSLMGKQCSTWFIGKVERLLYVWEMVSNVTSCSYNFGKCGRAPQARYPTSARTIASEGSSVGGAHYVEHIKSAICGRG